MFPMVSVDRMGTTKSPALISIELIMMMSVLNRDYFFLHRIDFTTRHNNIHDHDIYTGENTN